MLDMHSPDSRTKLNWGKASDSERSAYTDKCSELLGTETFISRERLYVARSPRVMM